MKDPDSGGGAGGLLRTGWSLFFQKSQPAACRHFSCSCFEFPAGGLLRV